MSRSLHGEFAKKGETWGQVYRDIVLSLRLVLRTAMPDVFTARFVGLIVLT